MKKQVQAFLLILFTVFFWFWIGSVFYQVFCLLFAQEYFSTLLLLISLALSATYFVILKTSPTIRRATATYADPGPLM